MDILDLKSLLLGHMKEKSTLPRLAKKNYDKKSPYKYQSDHSYDDGSYRLTSNQILKGHMHKDTPPKIMRNTFMKNSFEA
jgi:hypothetical protein